MNKNCIALFFSVLFMAMLSAPSIIIAIDNSADVSLFYSLTEEEEKEGKENKNIEVLLSEIKTYERNIQTSDYQRNLGYYCKKYSNPHLNLVSPPPDFQL